MYHSNCLSFNLLTHMSVIFLYYFIAPCIPSYYLFVWCTDYKQMLLVVVWIEFHTVSNLFTNIYIIGKCSNINIYILITSILKALAWGITRNYVYFTLLFPNRLIHSPVSVSHNFMYLSYEVDRKRSPVLLKSVSRIAWRCPEYVLTHLYRKDIVLENCKNLKVPEIKFALNWCIISIIECIIPALFVHLPKFYFCVHSSAE